MKQSEIYAVLTRHDLALNILQAQDKDESYFLPVDRHIRALHRYYMVTTVFYPAWASILGNKAPKEMAVRIRKVFWDDAGLIQSEIGIASCLILISFDIELVGKCIEITDVLCKS